MLYLAEQPKGQAVPLARIAQRQEVKPKYLELIFSRLRQAKLIATKKGPGGGYFLKRNPKTIRLNDVMTAVGESR